MESRTSNYFGYVIDSKIKASEELIELSRKQLEMDIPKIWQVKQMQKYFKNIKDIKDKMNQLEWLMDEINEIHVTVIKD